MEKLVTIDGKEVKLKAVGGCLRLYKLQFKRDMMRDLFKLKALEKHVVDGEFVADDEAVAKIDFEVFSDVLWTFAKKGDPSIPPPMEWEDNFSTIPFVQIYPEFSELLQALIEGAKK